MPVSIPFRLGRYEVVARIGAGGMGEVYRARDSKLGRDVAIKILPEVFTRDSERMARFEREARVLAALNHPSIAAIYGVEESGSADALIMELAEGPTLADRIRQGPIPLEEALPIARQIADALEYAHEHGVVHRDLKPANIKIAPDDSVKILDFGLAKAVQSEPDPSNAADSPTISHLATHSGVLLGTAAYMSPEQARGKQVDRRADIWAFGCVLYEMLTGRRAFPGEATAEILAAVLRSEPDWSQLPPATPTHVRILLQRCLQKDPRQRLRDSGDARISLDEVISGAVGSAPGVTIAAPAWRRILPWVLAAAAICAVAVLAFLHFREKQAAAPAQLLRYEIYLPPKSNLAKSTIQLSPDGKRLAFVAETDGVRQLWIRDLDSLAARALPGTERAGIPIWSPDGRSIAFQSGSKLYKVDLAGGAPQAICDAAIAIGGAWSPEGTIVFGSSRALMKVSASGGTPSPVDGLPAGEFSQQYPSFLPDGRHFLYVFRDGASPGWNSRIASVDAAENREPSKLLIPGNGIYVPASDSAGEQIIFQQKNGRLVAQAFDHSRGEVEGAPIPIADEVDDFTLSPSILAYTKTGTVQGQLTWFDRKGRMLGTVGEPGMIFPRPALSPDGRTVAVSRTDPSTGGADIWLYDLARGTRSRFTFNGRTMVAVWSPDGSHIAFSSGEGAFSVYSKAVSGLGKEELLDKGAANSKFAMDYSRDGRYLIEGVSSGNQDSVALLPLSAAGAGERRPVPFSEPGVDAVNPAVSPNGQWIAYDSDKSGRDEIYVETFPVRGGFWQVSVDGGTSPVWSADGRELYFISPDGKLMAVAVRSDAGGAFAAGVPQPLFNPHVWAFGRVSKFAVSKDGRFLFPVWIEHSEAHPITIVVNWQAGLRK